MNTNQRYPWTRYWVPRGTPVQIDGHGFLWDPKSDFGSYMNKEARTIDDLANVQCLILLGEPRMGKTTELEDLANRLRTDSVSNIHLIRLRSMESVVMLQEELRTIHSGLPAQARCTLLLDSLDEGMLTVKAMAAGVVKALQMFNSSQLYVRITCRAGNWPSTTEDELEELFGSRRPSVWELAPLRVADVHAAAALEGIRDPEAVISLIREKGLGSLASRPRTLRTLLLQYQAGQEISGTRVDLVHRGLVDIAEEHNPTRIDWDATGILTAHQRVKLAARIAALCVFANTGAILVGAGDASTNGMLILDDLMPAGDRDCLEGVTIKKETLIETLRTSLFTARTTAGSGWTFEFFYRSDAEFLAARHLSDQDIPIQQVMNLLVYPDDGHGRLAEALFETAAWLADMRQDVRGSLLSADPTILLRMDMRLLSDQERQDLVAKLITISQSDSLIVGTILSSHGSLPHLGHPGLAEQLRPILMSPEGSADARIVATVIAGACFTQELCGEIVTIATEPDAHPALRRRALEALQSLDITEHIGTIHNLLREVMAGKQPDPDDEFRGLVLDLLWPNNLSVQDMLEAISERRQPNFFGTYFNFIKRDAADRLEPKHLPIALTWARNIPTQNNDESDDTAEADARDDLARAVIYRAWEIAGVGTDLNELAATMLARLLHHQPLVPDDHIHDFLQSLRANTQGRRQLVIAMVEAASAMVRDEFETRLRGNRIAKMMQSEDLDWAVNQLAACEAGETFQWAHTIVERMRRSGIDYHERITETGLAVPILADVLRHYAESLVLLREWESVDDDPDEESPEKKMDSKEFSEPGNNDTPTLDTTIRAELENVHNGPTSTWKRLLTHFANARPPHRAIPFHNVTGSIGWRALEGNMQDAVIAAASTFLRTTYEHCNATDSRERTIPHSRSGFQALLLLSETEPSQLTALPTEHWAFWTPTIASYHVLNDDVDDAAYIKLLQQALQRHPDLFFETFEASLLEAKEYESSSLLRRFYRVWDARFDERIQRLIISGKLTGMKYRSAFVAMLHNNSPTALELALAQIEKLPDDAPDRETMISWAVILMHGAPDTAWPALQRHTEADTTFGPELLNALATDGWWSPSSLFHTLTATQLGEFIVLIETVLPSRWKITNDVYEENTEIQWHSQAGIINFWREELLTGLTRYAIAGAADALRYVQRRRPDLPGIGYRILQAEAEARRSGWRAPDVGRVRELLSNSRARLIRTEQELAGVLLEELRLCEAHLHGPGRPVKGLWDEREHARPKPEAALSDAVATWLRERLGHLGIEVHREPELRPRAGSTSGEQLDLYVTAPQSARQHVANQEQLRVIIEVKCCWNRRLFDDIHDQLGARYLRENNHTNTGIYLVGCYCCDCWDSTDGRKADSRSNGTKGEIEQRLSAMTVESSDDGGTVRTLVIDTSLR